MKKHFITRSSNLLLLLGIIIVVNILVGRMFFRLDVSEGKIYTLSDYSRRVVSDLSDPITVKAYFSRNLGQYNNLRLFVKDKLDDYRGYSHGRFNYELINPDEDEDLKKEAESYGIRPIQMQSLENDKLEVKLVYMGLVFIYGDQKEVMPVVTESANMEFDITSAVKRLTELSTPRVGILSGHGEPTTDKDLSQFKEVLAKNYDVVDVDLTTVPELDYDIQTMLLVDPVETFSDADKVKLDAYLMRGGRLGIFINQVDADMQTQSGTLKNLGLDDLLSKWGIRIEKNIIMDSEAGMVQVRMGGKGLMSMFPVSMMYPFFPKVTHFNQDLSISKSVEAAQLFFTSSIDTTLAATAGVQVQPFAWSSPKTKRMSGQYQLGIQEKYSDRDFPDGTQIYGAVYTGSFPSFGAGRPVSDSLGLSIEGASPETRIAVMGDGNFMQSQFVGKQVSNLELAQNVVDWLTQDEGLINIRSKAVTDRPLQEISAGVRSWIKWLNIVGAPIILIIFGMVRWQIHRKRSQQEV